MPQIERTVEIHAPLETVFAFVTDISNHKSLTPPETQEELLDAGIVPMCSGTVVKFRARYGGVRWTLASQIIRFDPPSSEHPGSAYFRDEQIRGPFALWRHEHWFTATDNGHTRLTDRFTYAAPLGPIGRLVERVWLNECVRKLLEDMQAAEKRLIEAEEFSEVGEER